MEKNIAEFRPIDSIIFDGRRIEKSSSSITFILNGGRVLKNIVLQDRTIVFKQNEQTNLRYNGESILIAINRLNLREHEIEYIIKDTINQKTIENSGLESKKTKLIYSYHEKN